MKFPVTTEDGSFLTPDETEALQERIAQANEAISLIFLQGLATYNSLGGEPAVKMTRAEFLAVYVPSMATALS